MDKDIIKSTLSVLLNEIDYKMVENLIGLWSKQVYQKAKVSNVSFVAHSCSIESDGKSYGLFERT